jgi:hypothetical protein
MHVPINNTLSLSSTIPLPPREQLYNRYCSNKHTPLRPSVDTGAGDRGGACAKFAVATETLCCREDAGETSAIISDTTVEHPADSFQGLPDAHAIVKHLSTKQRQNWEYINHGNLLVDGRGGRGAHADQLDG